jgi:hypothetical protein
MDRRSWLGSIAAFLVWICGWQKSPVVNGVLRLRRGQSVTLLWDDERKTQTFSGEPVREVLGPEDGSVFYLSMSMDRDGRIDGRSIISAN